MVWSSPSLIEILVSQQLQLSIAYEQLQFARDKSKVPTVAARDACARMKFRPQSDDLTRVEVCAWGGWYLRGAVERARGDFAKVMPRRAEWGRGGARRRSKP